TGQGRQLQRPHRGPRRLHPARPPTPLRFLSGVRGLHPQATAGPFSQAIHPMKISRAASIGKDVEIRFEDPAVISSNLRVRCGFDIGAYSYFRNGTVRRLASVGRYTSIGPNVMIGETEHPTDWLSTSNFQYSKRWRTK